MALEIFRLVGSVFVDTDAAEKSLKKTDKTAEGFGSKLVSVGKSVGKFALGVSAAAGAAGAAVIALTDNTREYRTEQGKLQTAFETANFTAETARKTYIALNGVLGDSGQAVEASNHLAKLCDTEEELTKWTDICTGIYATFGDSLPIEGLTEAANETAKTGALTGGLADALNWAGVNEDAFQEKLDKCNSEQERAVLITETMNGLYTDAADKYKELNADVIAANQAQDKLNNAMARVGGAMEPFITKGKQLLADVLTKALPFIENMAEEAIPVLTSAINAITPVVGSVFKVIGQLWESIGKPIFNGILAFVEGVFTGNFSKAFQGLLQIMQGIWNGLVGVVRVPVNSIVRIVNNFINGLNRIKVPDWVPSIGGKGISIPAIPYLEEGAVLERGQVGFLEGNGAEAVVPLHNNKKWISAVARDMDGALGGSDQTVALLQDVRDLLEQISKAGIYLDTGALVGGLAKPMDKKLGQIQAAKARG